MTPTESEIKIARYRQIEREADSFGRVIGVRRLKPSEQTKLVGMTDDLQGFDLTEVTDENGSIKKIEVPHRGPLMISAAVCEIDQNPIPFPRSRGELDSIFDRLDAEGLAAAVKAMVRLNTGATSDAKEEAKN